MLASRWCALAKGGVGWGTYWFTYLSFGVKSQLLAPFIYKKIIFSRFINHLSGSLFLNAKRFGLILWRKGQTIANN